MELEEKNEREKDEENATQVKMKGTSINIDSRASIVPFRLQEEVIILAFNGRTKTSAAAEQEK